MSSAAYLLRGTHEPEECHGLLVLDLTVVPRDERVSFVHSISFTAKNIAEDATARDELIGKTGRMAVPVITVDDEVVVGFDRGRLQRLPRAPQGQPGRALGCLSQRLALVKGTVSTASCDSVNSHDRQEA